MKFIHEIITLFKRKPKQLTKIEIIDYVVDYFQKNPRAIADTKCLFGESTSACLYLTKTGLRCGHSICLEDDFVKSTYINEGVNAETLINKYGDDIHKPQFRGHHTSFWLDIQRFHDRDTFWRDYELTDDGKEFVRELKEKYSNI